MRQRSKLHWSMVVCRPWAIVVYNVEPTLGQRRNAIWVATTMPSLSWICESESFIILILCLCHIMTYFLWILLMLARMRRLMEWLLTLQWGWRKSLWLYCTAHRGKWNGYQIGVKGEWSANLLWICGVISKGWCNQGALSPGIINWYHRTWWWLVILECFIICIHWRFLLT